MLKQYIPIDQEWANRTIKSLISSTLQQYNANNVHDRIGTNLDSGQPITILSKVEREYEKLAWFRTQANNPMLDTLEDFNEEQHTMFIKYTEDFEKTFREATKPKVVV
jgi:myo-inositol-hexaphosphate 3-phosphohydrolase